VVVLYFWRIQYAPSVSSLPSRGQRATRFQPRGVWFLAIHHAESDEEIALEQGRKVLARKGAPLALAIDQSRVPRHALGMTAVRYALQSGVPPVIIVIDRAGKIAFRSDSATGAGNLNVVFMQMLQNPANMTEDTANDRVEQTLAFEIERTVRHRD
jgi:hypothetical protein